MKELLHTFKKSVYDPHFYRTIDDDSLKQGLHFYVKFSLILSVLMMLVFSVFMVPRGVLFVRDVAPALVQKYFPEELTVTLEGGHASVNVPEPYIIPMTPNLNTAFGGQGITNVLVINTQEDFSLEAFKNYHTFAWLTKDQIVTQNTQGQITISSLAEPVRMVINQATILDAIEKIRASLVYVVPLGLLGTLAVLFLGLLLYLVPLFLFALIPLCFSWIKKVKMSYKTAYIVSLHAIMPGLALKSLLNMVGMFFLPASFNILLFLLIVVVNLRELDKPVPLDK